MKIFISLFLLITCAFADNNYGEKIYSGNVTIDGYFYNMESGKIIVNQGAKITYNSSVDNRGYYENNGEIIMNDSATTFSNVINGVFINNGRATFSNAFSNSSTATFYADAKAEIIYGNGSRASGTFRNWKGGIFSIIGATLSGDFVQENGYGVSGTIQTLIFGIRNSKMGQINGNLTNTSGVVNVNIANMVYGTHYKIITGTIAGLDSVSFVGANLSDIITHYENGEVWIEKKSTEPDKPNPDNPNPPPKCLTRLA